MGNSARFRPRDEWSVIEARLLERVGIGRYETIQTIRPKIEALGLKILAMNEYWGGVLSSYPLYYAAVIDPSDENAIQGEYWSRTDYAEALARATARVLDDREQRTQQRQAFLASSEPNDYAFSEFGPSVEAARIYLGDRLQEASIHDHVAQVVVEDEIVARAAMPFLRGGEEWDSQKEASLLTILIQWAHEFDVKDRVGLVKLILDPGTLQQQEYLINRGNESG